MPAVIKGEPLLKDESNGCSAATAHALRMVHTRYMVRVAIGDSPRLYLHACESVARALRPRCYRRLVVIAFIAIHRWPEVARSCSGCVFWEARHCFKPNTPQSFRRTTANDTSAKQLASNKLRPV